MIVGYARTSTSQQEAGFDAQLRDLQEANCEKVFSEMVSSVAERDQLKACLAFVREGDTLIVTKPDRLARSTLDLLSIITDLEKRKVGLILLSMGGQRIDTTNATGKLIITIMGAIAQFEREMMLERQLEGISKAHAEGKYRGRPANLAMHDQVRAASDSGESPSEIARRFGCSRQHVYRILAGALPPA